MDAPVVVEVPVPVAGADPVGVPVPEPVFVPVLAPVEEVPVVELALLLSSAPGAPFPNAEYV